MKLSRRDFALGALVLPLACEKREPETPLAHLYGRDWVRGAYSHYASTYDELERRAQAQSFSSYRLLAERGVTALEGLQSREVPFFVRVSEDSERFRIERDVPERLTFTAGMSASEREEATRVHKLARDNVHRDYEQVRGLEGALTTLLSEVGHVRVAIDEGRLEQYRIVRQLGDLSAGGELPFRLPYQVSRDDYQSVLLLLLERLEADSERLAAAEASMVAVGLVVRATDAGSASLAPNVQKVLLAVAEDSAKVEAARRAVEYPEGSEPLLARGRELSQKIAQSEGYRAWLAAEREREDQLGSFLAVLDTLTGLPLSTVYRQVMRVWRGDGDYLQYLKLAAGFVPGTSGLSSVLGTAVQDTERYRDMLATADRARRIAESARNPEQGAAEVEGAVVNVGSRYARDRLGRQLVFYKDASELEAVRAAVAESKLTR